MKQEYLDEIHEIILYRECSESDIPRIVAICEQTGKSPIQVMNEEGLGYCIESVRVLVDRIRELPNKTEKELFSIIMKEKRGCVSLTLLERAIGFVRRNEPIYQDF